MILLPTFTEKLEAICQDFFLCPVKSVPHPSSFFAAYVGKADASVPWLSESIPSYLLKNLAILTLPSIFNLVVLNY